MLFRSMAFRFLTSGNGRGVQIGDEVEYHAAGVIGDFHTLCGLDADDPGIDAMGAVAAKRGQKITCSSCHTIWRGVVDMGLRQSNFEVTHG